MRATVIRTTTALTAAVSMLALSACSPGGSGDLDWSDSPLTSYFEDLYGAGMNWDEDEMNERERRVQELVAACMSAEGFEYYPVVNDMIISMPSPDGDGTENLWEPEKREWVEKYGYGIVNDPWRLSGAWDEPMPMPGPDEEYTDPNWDYFETLSESEQRAYEKALYGDSIVYYEEDFAEGGVIVGDGPEEFPDPASQDYGCYGKANDEVYAENNDLSAVWEDPQFEAVMEAMNELYAQSESHPDRTALDRNWSTCMAEGGHSGYFTRGEPENALYQELEAFYEQEIYDIWDLPEVQELGQREIEIALVDFDCRDELDYDNEMLRIQFALEEQFIADYKVELDALKQAFQQAAN